MSGPRQWIQPLGRLRPGARRRRALDASLRAVMERMDDLEARLADVQVESAVQHMTQMDELSRWGNELAAAIPRFAGAASPPVTPAVRARLEDLVRRLDQLAGEGS